MTFKTLLGKRRRIKRPVIYLINWEKNSRSKLQTKVKDFLKVLNYLDQLKRDDEKLSFCNLNNIKLLEVHEGCLDFNTLHKEIV